MRLCPRCGQEKPVDQFHLNAARGVQVYCISCRKEYDHRYWLKVREKRIAVKVAKRNERKLAMQRQKSRTPCADCDMTYHFAAMHWDHLPGFEKKSSISALLSANPSEGMIQKELAKCELVCANCHAVRTYNRRSVG